MESSGLQKIAALVQDLPALPVVAQQALALLSNPTTEPEELQEVLYRDPAISLKVLRLANSAFYRRKRQISTLTSAILLLGFKTIHTLILSSAVHRMLSTAGADASCLWDHCFATALGCREVGRRLPHACRDAEEAFLAGLFHDAGKGVIAARFPGIYRQPLSAQGELATLGFHHGHLGQILLAKWEIPEGLTVAVGTHHNAEPVGLGRLTAIADWLAWDLAPGLGEKPQAPVALLESLGLGGRSLDDLRRAVETSVAEETGDGNP